MIIGDNKGAVIQNMKEAVQREAYNDKVEVDDPNLSAEEKSEIINHYLQNYRTLGYKICNWLARCVIDTVTKTENRSTQVRGLDNLTGITDGAIVTSNHFNPLDNTVVRCAVKKAGYKRLYIVSQETNLAMKGIVGFLMNHADIIPLTNSKKYLETYFPPLLQKILSKKGLILIYPEQEMWFNYRKPRPPKRGAYYYAAQNYVPVISCFVEIRDTSEKETAQFYKTEQIIHILEPIYPDRSLSVRENSKIMMAADYRQKVAAYEQAYGKKLNYDFEESDIAGWIPNGGSLEGK